MSKPLTFKQTASHEPLPEGYYWAAVHKRGNIPKWEAKEARPYMDVEYAVQRFSEMREFFLAKGLPAYNLKYCGIQPKK